MEVKDEEFKDEEFKDDELKDVDFEDEEFKDDEFKDRKFNVVFVFQISIFVCEKVKIQSEIHKIAHMRQEHVLGSRQLFAARPCFILR